MAGISWIKVETTLPNKPVVQFVKRAVRRNRYEVVGLLISLLCWADGITENGVCEGYAPDDVDEHFGVQGLANGLIDAGWMTVNEDGWVCFCKWDHHNGESAKKRAVNARANVALRSRKRVARDESVMENNHARDESVMENNHARDESVMENNELDKIRIDKSANALNAGACACEDFADSGTAEVETLERDTRSGAAELCKAYPKRTFLNATVQAAYDGCLAEGITHEVLTECLRLEKLSPAWCEQNGRYIPKLVVWLNERRFEPHLKQAQRVRPAVTMNKQALIDDLPEGI